MHTFCMSNTRLTKCMKDKNERYHITNNRLAGSDMTVIIMKQSLVVLHNNL